MLPRSSGGDDLPHPNMTPMVDIVLCLLVFFMAATKIYDWDEQQFTVKVPEVGNAPPLTAAPRDLTIVILDSHEVEMEGARLTLPQLTATLVAAKKRYSEQGVLIRGDARRSYQDVADVLAACETAGIVSVKLPVRPRVEQVQSP